MHCRQVSFSVLYNFVGAVKKLNCIPSSSACWISSLCAGISLRDRRYRTVTFPPRRLAVRAESIATFPPPMTRIVFPLKYSGAIIFRFSCLRYSTPSRTQVSVPVQHSIPAARVLCAPMASKIALNPCFFRSATEKSLPSF